MYHVFLNFQNGAFYNVFGVTARCADSRAPTGTRRYTVYVTRVTMWLLAKLDSFYIRYPTAVR